MADIWKDFWICETGAGQQVTQVNDRYDDDDGDDDDDDDDVYFLAGVAFWVLVTMLCFTLLSGKV